MKLVVFGWLVEIALFWLYGLVYKFASHESQAY